MSMTFRYRLISTPAPVVTLGGRFVRPRPLIHVSLIGPQGTFVRLCLLDTGSEDTLFSMDAATAIGLDLTNAPRGDAKGLGMVAHPVRFAEVTLRVAQSGEHYEWSAWVGFTTAKI